MNTDNVSAAPAPAPVMRAKLKITSVTLSEHSDQLKLSAVCKSTAYPDSGLDEDNTYAKFTPTAELSMTINNPALLGKFRPGQKFYVDFTEVRGVSGSVS